MEAFSMRLDSGWDEAEGLLRFIAILKSPLHSFDLIYRAFQGRTVPTLGTLHPLKVDAPDLVRRNRAPALRADSI
jgi:hypothetical protein